MSNESSTENLLKEAESLLNLLPDPNIELHRWEGHAEVYAGKVSENIPGSIKGVKGEPMVKVGNFEVQTYYEPKEIIQLHGERGRALQEDDIREYFYEEMGNRNAEFFVKAPQLIQKLRNRLQELSND